MTLLNLDEVAEHVRRENHVVLMIAPCGKCYEPKHRVLKATLGQENQFGDPPDFRPQIRGQFARRKVI